MKFLPKLVLAATAIFALVVITACNRNSSPQLADNNRDQTVAAVDQKMDQAKTTMQQQADKVGTVVNDTAITAKVKTAIIDEPGLKSMQINVNTENGIVTLTGTIDTPQKMDRALQIAQAVEGVKSVNNQLYVKTPS
jgi:hyperosmotically inducible protein